MRVTKNKNANLKKLGLKNYKEAVKRAKRLIRESEGENLTFAELVKPARELLDNIQTMDLPPVPNEFFTDANIEMDVSEEDLDDTTGELAESVKRSRALKEGVGTSEAVKAYIAQGGAQSYEDFLDWCQQNGRDDAAANTPKGTFNTKYRQYSNGAVAASKVFEPVAPVEEPSESLKSFMDMIDAGTEIAYNAADAVRDKYRSINGKLRRVLQKKSSKNYFLLMGDAGIGKSYILRETLDKLGMGDTETITGSIGTNQSAVAYFLWTTKDKDVVILDDCDTMIMRDVDMNVSNMLKGAMDPDRHHVHISPTIQAKAQKFLDAMKENAAHKGNKLFEAEDEDADLDLDLDFGGNEDSDEETMLDTVDKEKLPSDWDYNAQIIFVSNLVTTQVNPAILSRCDYYELHLTPEEYMIRLGDIIAKIEIKGAWNPEDISNTKALIMLAMTNIIEAANKRLTIFGKRIALKKGGLEFRLVSDLTDAYLGLVDDALFEETGSGINDADPTAKDNMMKKLISKWVRMYVIPRVCA